MKILAICGSLRKTSTNKTLLEVAARCAPPGMTLSLFEGLDDLPHFNPDLEKQEPPVVTRFRETIQAADGIVLSSPEYAHGVPGSLKNALDWLVGGSEMVGKPVALFDASTRSSYAQDSLREILRTMSVHLVEEAFVGVPLLGKNLGIEEILADPGKTQPLVKALEAFKRTIEASKGAG